MSPRQMGLHLVDLAGAIADDLVCLARIALLRRTLGQRAEAWAKCVHLPSDKQQTLTWYSRFWLLTTLIGLYKLHSTGHETRKTKEQLKEAKWTNRKLLADLLFVCTSTSRVLRECADMCIHDYTAYDILDPDLPSPIRSILGEPLKCTTGLVSGFIRHVLLWRVT